MSRELPKAARELLARQTVGEAHLSPELLNAFVEQSLAAGEKDRVTSHLAGCAECREVVFLISATAQQEAEAPLAAPSHGWRRWRWTIPAAALVTIVSVVVVQRYRTTMSSERTPTLSASNRVSQPPATTTAVQTPAIAGPISPAQAVKPQAAAGAIRQGQQAQMATGLNQHRALMPESPPANVTEGQLSQNELKESLRKSAAKRSTPIPGPAPQTADARFGATGAEQDGLLKTQTQGGPIATVPMRSSLLARPGAQAEEGVRDGISPASAPRTLGERRAWRITPEGHVEHLVAPDSWTQVMAEQPATFHVIAVVGDNVWAGGDDGLLFRSPDGGEHWTRVVLGAGDKAENGRITTIRFNTAQQGSIRTEVGTEWVTADGGQTWTKQ